jgi:PAS domain-containing protein
VLTRKKLAEAEERSRFALDSAELGAWDMDPANQRVTWDERCNQLHGFLPGEVTVYSDVLKHIHPDDLENIKQNVQAAINPMG